ncbi:SpoIIE family protein phosphatase [Spirosoma arcticum]
MANSLHRSYPVVDRSYVSIIKRDVRALAGGLGFSSARLSELDIIIAELTSNLVKYAQAGELLVRVIPNPVNAGIELISADSGPGMVDPARMMIDGMSTGGSLGQGLGAIGRLADLFQLYSLPGRGTIGLVRVFPVPPKRLLVAPAATAQALLVSKVDQMPCGDGFYCKLTTTSLRMFLGDGLGHGLPAHQAVRQAIQAMAQQRDDSPAAWLTAIHRAAIGTRGLVGTAAVFNFATRKWMLCGVGNIRTQLCGGSYIKSYAAQNGILGYNMPRVLQEHELPYEPGQCLVMASDGIQTRWNPTRYPNAGRYDPMVLAAAIYKEYGRQTDDMSVAVARIY